MVCGCNGKMKLNHNEWVCENCGEVFYNGLLHD